MVKVDWNDCTDRLTWLFVCDFIETILKYFVQMHWLVVTGGHFRFTTGGWEHNETTGYYTNATARTLSPLNTFRIRKISPILPFFFVTIHILYCNTRKNLHNRVHILIFSKLINNYVCFYEIYLTFAEFCQKQLKTKKYSKTIIILKPG